MELSKCASVAIKAHETFLPIPAKTIVSDSGCKRASLLQLINRVRQSLLVWLYIPPDVAIALMPGGLAGIVNAFFLCELAQKRMPQHVGGDIDFLIFGEMGIGLGGNTEDDTIRFTARELAAGARQKEG